MAIFKCKMCGGSLEIEQGTTVYECSYCGTKQTVPHADDDKKMLLFSRANRLRFDCEFDKASGVYESIVADFPEEAEAYWGLVLCKYGIEYVDDPATAKKVPTCHRSSFESVMEDPNFDLVMEYSDNVSRSIYREEAKKIEELRKGIIEVSSKEDPYDIFICYKETDFDGNRTLDSVLAQDIYDALTEKGYRVFFSRISLEEKLGVEYEPYIFAALNSAKIMLAFGTDYEYFNAVWVKNEWSRFLQLIAKGEKKTLIPCFKDIDAYDLPKEFAKLQSQDLGKVGATQDLLRGIDKIIKSDGKSSASQVQQGKNLTLLDEVFLLIEDGNFKTADKYCDAVLKEDPKNAKAYLGKLMAQLKVTHFNAKSFAKKRYSKNENYLKAIEYGGEYIKEKFEGFKAYRSKAVLKNAIISVASVIALVAIICATVTLVCESLYNNYRMEFYSVNPNYEEIEQKFSKLYGYKDSESFVLLCGVKCNKTYTNVYELEYTTDWQDVRLAKHFPKLEAVTISEGVTNIGKWTFYKCSSLKTVTLPDTLKSIEENAFSLCNSLETVILPEQTTNIGPYAFAGCINLNTITIPEKATIGERAFAGCTNLYNVDIPNSVRNIGINAFKNCPISKDVLPEKFRDNAVSIGVFQ